MKDYILIWVGISLLWQSVVLAGKIGLKSDDGFIGLITKKGFLKVYGLFVLGLVFLAFVEK